MKTVTMTYRMPELTLGPAPCAISLFAPLMRTLKVLLSELQQSPLVVVLPSVVSVAHSQPVGKKRILYVRRSTEA